MKELISKLIKKEDLSKEDVIRVVDSIEKNDFEPLQLGELLIALESKGVTADELYYFVEQLIKKAVIVDVSGDCIDVCGTGGDGKKTFNVSTAASFVVAGCGVKVAKHGNKAISSKSGSFDALDELKIKADIEKNKNCLENAGIGFFFAPQHHPVFKNIAEVRKNLGVRTIFNMIGPLLSPCKVKRQLIGVFDLNLTELIAETMKKNGIEHGMVVHGNGLDEITIDGKTKITELKDGEIKTYDIGPKDFGLEEGLTEELVVSSAKESSDVITNVFNGKKSSARNIVVLNAAAGLIVAGEAKDFNEGVKMAQDCIDSGKAIEKLKSVQEIMEDNDK